MIGHIVKLGIAAILSTAIAYAAPGARDIQVGQGDFPTIATNQTRMPIVISPQWTPLYPEIPGDGGGGSGTTCTKNQMCQDDGGGKGHCVTETESGTGCKKSGTTCLDCRT
jgi:hypothetical protein